MPADFRDSIVREAREWVGTPYRHQGALKGVGADCLGLVRGVWRAVYGQEPEPVPGYQPGWAEAERRERLMEAARRHMTEIGRDDWDAGDLLLFRWRPHLPAKHAAIATSRTSMVHAQDGAAVCEVAVSPWWRRHLAYAFSFRCQRRSMPFLLSSPGLTGPPIPPPARRPDGSPGQAGG